MIDYCVAILSHGRANKVKTVKCLKDYGYTGKVFIVCDDGDAQLGEYKRIYGDSVLVFSKNDYRHIDTHDNAGNDNCVLFARHAVTDLMIKAGFKYYIVMDDDYINFLTKFDKEKKYKEQKVKNICVIFDLMFDYFVKAGLYTLCTLQNGDYLGGECSQMAKKIFIKRKAMNVFLCSTDNPLQFTGRINEDVNMYVVQGSIGKLCFSINIVSLQQTDTQQNNGGLTEIYLETGTYFKSFMSVMCAPSAVKIYAMNSKDSRVHHKVNYNKCTPKILNELHRKARL
jgi:hypothetical protein